MDSSWGLGIFSDNIMSVDSFGLSAPAKDVVNSFGFNKENVADRIIDILKNKILGDLYGTKENYFNRR